jgi:glycosyltransferase involved in cell wall biosynthesis
MRILISGIHHREVRGPNIFIHGLARTLRDRGHDVSLLQAARPEHQVAIDGVRMLYLSSPRKKSYPLRFALRGIGSYDVIHAHDAGAAGFALRSRLQRVPLVAQFHLPRVHQEPVWQANWRWRFQAVAVWNAPVRLTATHWLAGALAERFGLAAADFHVIPYGIGEHWFEAERPVQTDESPVRIALINMKGVDVALRAFARAAPQGEAFLDLYGIHDDTPRYRQLAAELGIDKRVAFHGFVQNAELPARLARTQLVLHPNRKGNMDQVLCETQALGLPVVASRINGNPECVEEDATALLCPVDDVEAFANGLRRLLASAPLRDRLARAARERAARIFPWSRAVERLEREIYEPLARGEWPRPAR